MTARLVGDSAGLSGGDGTTALVPTSDVVQSKGVSQAIDRVLVP